MTPLAQALIQQIAATGPITVADYMAACLLHPRHGYYTTRQPLGAAGDFTTAPEISQMFGELVGLWLAQAWADQGRPGHFVLAELGPGRGTLMADALRALAALPGAVEAAELHLVEASPTLRDTQKATLHGHAAHWHDSIETLPDDQPLFLIANEFFDALPVRQFLRDGDAWRERQVGLADDRLTFGLSAPMAVPQLDPRLPNTETGDMVTLCPAAGPIVEEIARRITRHGGAALIVDYGSQAPKGDTLQAVRGHAKEDPLANPGEADLTAHVDFAALADAAAPAHATPPIPQGVFLERLGITQRAQALAAKLSGAALDQHIAAHRRLTHPQEMGSLFLAMGIAPPGAPPLPGFET